jgi:UDP-glucose:(heptosyl)LPS alpha-1,3-glucosyltransferase
LKLALVRQKYNPYGGAERFVERALGALERQGVAVTLITRKWKDGAQGQGAAGRQVRICNPFHLGRLWRDAGFSRCVQRLVASGEFDLVQSHERIPGCHVYRAGDGVHATWLELRARVQSPLARLATVLHPWHRYTLAAEAAMFRHPALQAVICNSAMVRDDIMRRFQLAPEKLHVIHNGVDLDFFHPGLRAEHRGQLRAQLGIPDDAPVLLYVGSGFERKGVPQLLAALARLPGNTHLLVVGKDKQAANMGQLATRLGVQQRSHFVGGQTDVRPYYGAADVFVLPTLYDPFPNAVLEALACGLPVLTSPGSGGAELVTPACGAVVDALDVPALARSAEALLALDPIRAATAAREAASRCALSDMTARLLALYASLESTQPAQKAPV